SVLLFGASGGVLGNPRSVRPRADARPAQLRFWGRNIQPRGDVLFLPDAVPAVPGRYGGSEATLAPHAAAQTGAAVAAEDAGGTGSADRAYDGQGPCPTTADAAGGCRCAGAVHRGADR